MTHFNDDELVLFYYGESRSAAAIEGHLKACPRCSGAHEAIARTLARITAPELPAPSEEFRVGMREQVRRRIMEGDPAGWTPGPHAVRRNLELALLVWLVPVLYPFSFLAVFNSARLAREYSTVGVPLVLLSLMWALAGPVVALCALNRIQRGQVDRTRQRLVVYGALVATISPALFNLTSRTGLGLPMWYGASALGVIAALLPMTESAGSRERLRLAHRISGMAILLFAVAHIANQAFAVISVSTHTTVQDALRLVYRQPIVEMVVLAAIALQVGTGVTMWRAKLLDASRSATLQAVSGWYLAAFFLAHVLAVMVARQHHTETSFVWAAGRAGLLASPRSASQLPYYLLGIAALFVHAGAYARVRALGFMPELSVQRLSYALMAFGGVMVLVIGLALCGIRVVP